MREIQLRFLSRTLIIGVLFISISFTSFPQKSSLPKFRSTIISRAQLPNRFDKDRTFVYQSISVNAESLLTAIQKSGIVFRRAWLPLDNLCMDIIGPRFTIELSTADTRITSFGFTRGEGRLYCATRLKLFTLSR